MGGRISFLANATLPVKAGVSYYSGYISKVADKAGSVTAGTCFFGVGWISISDRIR